ncbi:MAG TPA: hypothetical protein VKT82_03225 [Ktedonobacterales bacterium]|nr:hypothetical protein [Ktedonobacterales bacterium]
MSAFIVLASTPGGIALLLAAGLAYRAVLTGPNQTLERTYQEPRVATRVAGISW